MSEMYPPPPPWGRDPNSPSEGQGQTMPDGAWQQQQPNQPYPAQQPPAYGAGPSQPYAGQQPPYPAAPSQPLYPSQGQYPGAAPSQPLYPPPYPAAPSQPLYGQQMPGGYPGYPGAPMGPAYVRTNLGEYWKNAKNGKRNLSILIAIFVALFVLNGVRGIISGVNAANSVAAISGQGNQNSGLPPIPTLAPTDTPAPVATTGASATEKAYEASTKAVTVTALAQGEKTYYNKNIVFTGVIDALLTDNNNKIAGAAVSDPANPKIEIVVAFTPDFDTTQVHEQDKFKVWGQEQGYISVTNNNGTKTKYTVVQEVYLADSTSGYHDHTVTDPASVTQ